MRLLKSDDEFHQNAKDYFEYIKTPLEQLECIEYLGENDLTSLAQNSIENENALTAQ